MSGSLHAHALPLVVVALILGAGCVGGLPGDLGPGESTPSTPTPTTPGTTTQPDQTPTAGTPDPTRGTLEPMSLPWKPDPLVAGNVEVYVREYERSVRYNEALGPSVVDVELTCQATLVAEVEAGYVARAECGGSIHSQADDGATSVEPTAPERVTYVVGDDLLERIDGSDRKFEPYRANGSNVATPEGIAVVNADDRAHEIRLAVRYDADGTNDTVLAERYGLPAGEGLNLKRVAARKGVYNVTVEVGNETTVRYRWQVDPDERRSPEGLGVVVTPEGDVLVVDLARMR